MYSLFRAMQKMGQMFEQTEIIDKTSKKKLRLKIPLQSGTWSRLLQNQFLRSIDLPWEERAWNVPVS